MSFECEEVDQRKTLYYIVKYESNIPLEGKRGLYTYGIACLSVNAS